MKNVLKRAHFLKLQNLQTNNNVVGQFTSFNNQTTSTITARTILALNDDCLKNIFDYLALNDRLTISKSCKRFKKIVINIPVALVLQPGESLESIELFGRKATHLEICNFINKTNSKKVRNIMIKKLQKHCKHIKTMKLVITTALNILSSKFFKNIVSQLNLLSIRAYNAQNIKWDFLYWQWYNIF